MPYLRVKNELPLIPGYASGDIVSFSDAAVAPLNMLKLTVIASQSGSGDPSPDNIRPITGHTQANIYHNNGVDIYTTTGISTQTQASLTVLTNNSFNISRTTSTWGATKQTPDSLSLTIGKKYLLTCDVEYTSGTALFAIRALDNHIITQSDELKANGKLSLIFTLENNTDYLSFFCSYNESTGNITYKNINLQEFDEKTASFGQTVYGATIDPLTGTGSITHGYIASYDGETIGTPWICDRAVYAPDTTPPTGSEVCYPLASPTPITFTPIPNINNLNGPNIIFADCGPIDLTYIRRLES